jgi:hypothetical protein
LDNLKSVIHTAQAVAKRYRELTGRSLGVTGQVAEVLAAEILGLQLADDPQQKGYDALRGEQKIQIKGRCILDPKKPAGRLGKIRLDAEWDCILLVILDPDLEVIEMWEAGRPAVKEELTRPGSKARNEQGQMSVSKFKSIGELIWKKGEGV